MLQGRNAIFDVKIDVQTLSHATRPNQHIKLSENYILIPESNLIVSPVMYKSTTLVIFKVQSTYKSCSSIGRVVSITRTCPKLDQRVKTCRHVTNNTSLCKRCMSNDKVNQDIFLYDLFLFQNRNIFYF